MKLRSSFFSESVCFNFRNTEVKEIQNKLRRKKHVIFRNISSSSFSSSTREKQSDAIKIYLLCLCTLFYFRR
jgi:hypothetical protein